MCLDDDNANGLSSRLTRITFYGRGGRRFVQSVADRLEAEGWTVTTTIETDGPEGSCVPDAIKPYLIGSRVSGLTKPPSTYGATESNAESQ